ncbi:Asp/Glu/hydantoin racemase [Cupriavidus taiwanensis]|uniref:Asp/Glu/hydantoin racemase n=1 Tax=Cupriavidus taiwanensis TaxID=164546 RepID=A0A975WV93_9BURK|nr:aspartate/glutamate racemase family protein [Cupriavidus taiwanensis]SOY46102.1 Asp/Glu/hydantoin racemase [Cupriavidus taiwanensis]
MIRSIAFIHTVALLSERLRSRFVQELPDQRCFHMLDESVLQDLLRDGHSPAITRRIVTLAMLAADSGADMIVFTCSSTSPAIDTARKLVQVPIVKIDDAMYAEVARSHGRVGLLCTTRSTLEPSRSLLAEHVAATGTCVEAETVLVDGAFDALCAGKCEEHDTLVTESALALAQRTDRLVLAQASLAHLVEPLAQRTGKPVFTSAEWMVRDVIARVAAAV